MHSTKEGKEAGKRNDIVVHALERGRQLRDPRQIGVGDWLEGVQCSWG